MKHQQIDEVIQEIPVYLSRDISSSLFLLQYPFMKIEESEMLMYKGRVKPNTRQLHLSHLLPTGKNNFDEVKAEDMRYEPKNADNKTRSDADDEEFLGSRMDNIVTSSTVVLKNPHQDFMVGKIYDKALHLVPFTETMRMEANFNHLNINDDQKTDDDDEEQKEEEAKKVTVHFEKYQSKDASERSKFYRERSYYYQQKQIEQEDWIPLTVFPAHNFESQADAERLVCTEKLDVSHQFSMSSEEYLKAICLYQEGKNGSIYCKKVRNSLPIKERVLLLMKSATLASFQEVLTLIEAKTEDEETVLSALQEHCVLVQGIWVINSSLIFPEEESSNSEVSSQVLSKARDYILYLFTVDTLVKQEQFDNFANISDNDLKNILRSFSYNVEKSTWKFTLPTDTDFISKYPFIVQKQQMIWTSRHQQCNQLANRQTPKRVRRR